MDVTMAPFDAAHSDLYHATDGVQFRWLNNEYLGGNQPENYVWHHHEETGRFQLVMENIHRLTTHDGGRSPGHWAYVPDLPGR